MFNTIVVANDGSENAQHATEVASDIAIKYNSEIIMVHVVEQRFITDALQRYAKMEPLRILDDIQTSEVQERMKTLAHDAAQHVDSLRESSTHMGQHALDLGEHVAREKGVKKVQTILEFGSPAREILRHANSSNADLIVTGRSGHGHHAPDPVLGSVANRVNHGAHCSYLAVGKSVG